MEKIFAKPFVKALEGHTDSVKCMAIARRPGAPLLSAPVKTREGHRRSGSCNGELHLWNMQQLCLGHSVAKAHEGFVRGVTMSMDGRHAFSCGDDKVRSLEHV